MRTHVQREYTTRTGRQRTAFYPVADAPDPVNSVRAAMVLAMLATGAPTAAKAARKLEGAEVYETNGGRVIDAATTAAWIASPVASACFEAELRRLGEVA